MNHAINQLLLQELNRIKGFNAVRFIGLALFIVLGFEQMDQPLALPFRISLLYIINVLSHNMKETQKLQERNELTVTFDMSLYWDKWNTPYVKPHVWTVISGMRKSLCLTQFDMNFSHEVCLEVPNTRKINVKSHFWSVKFTSVWCSENSLTITGLNQVTQTLFITELFFLTKQLWKCHQKVF